MNTPRLVTVLALSVSPSMAAAPAAKAPIVIDGACAVVQAANNLSDWDTGAFFPLQLAGLGKQLNLAVRVKTPPQHGTLAQLSPKEALGQGVGPESGPIFSYHPAAKYLGPDSAVMTIDASEPYEFRMQFYVVEQKNDSDWYEQGTPATLCAQSKAKRVARSFWRVAT